MKDETAETLMSCGIAIIMIPFILTTVYILDGFVLMKLWGWFISGTFEAAPPISLVQAIGISMTISFIASARISPDSDEDKSQTRKSVEFGLKYYLVPVVTLGAGYIVTLFM